MWNHIFAKMTHDSVPEHKKIISWEATGTQRLFPEV